MVRVKYLKRTSAYPAGTVVEIQDHVFGDLNKRGFVEETTEAVNTQPSNVAKVMQQKAKAKAEVPVEETTESEAGAETITTKNNQKK